MSKSLVILFLAIISTFCNAKDEDNTACNGTAPVLNETSGSLKMKVSIDQLKGKTCEWIIEGTDKKDLFIYLGIKENLILGDSDVLTIEDNKTSVTLYNTTGFQLPGVILFGNKNPVILVKLILSNENIARNWEVDYATNGTSFQIQNIENIGSFVFPYLSDGWDNKTDINFNITLASKIKSKKLLLNVEELDLNSGTVAFDKVEKYKISDTFDGKKEPKIPDFVLSSDNQINIIISATKISSDKKGLRMHYDLVDSVCSQYKQITVLDNDKDTEDVLLPNDTTIKSLSSYRCLNVFEHKEPTAKLLINWRTFGFINTGDLITVLDGNTHDSKTMAIVESQFFDIYWKQLYLYSSANKLWVMFDSPQVINRNTNSSNTFGISSLSQGGSYIFESNKTQTKLSLNSKSKPPIPVVFTFMASDFNKQIVIDFDNSKVLPGTGGSLMDIYENTGREGQPFIKLNSKQTPPDIMASNTNQMKIVFNQIVDFDVDIQEVDRGCHSTYLGTSGASYILSGCQPICSWLIPKRDNSNGTFILQFSHLDLVKDDILLIERQEESSKTSSVLNLEGPLQTTTFPDLILSSNETYVLYTKRKCDNSSIDGSQMVGVSLVYVKQNLSVNQENVKTGDNIVLKTPNYPNYYFVGSDHLWRIYSNNSESKALLTFTDIDLSPNHQILLRSDGLIQDINFTQQLSDISDNFIVKLPLVMNLSSGSKDRLKQPFSGRGFTTNLTIVNCGATVTVKEKEETLSTPNNLTGISKCIWIVNTDNPNKNIGLINFTLNGGKDFDNKTLKIWDSNSIRENKFVNYSIFKAHNDSDIIYLSSSTNYLIFEYNITDPKKDLSLKVTMNQQVCRQKCVNTNRCYLPEFHCNGVDDCGDYSDESDCNGSGPLPPGPDPTPIIYRSGVNGWVVTLVLCPLFIGIGVLGTLYGPRLLNRVGRGRYSEFQDFSEVS